MGKEEEDFDNWKRKQSGLGTKISRNFSVWYIIIGGVVFFFAQSLVARGIINTSVFVTLLIVGIALIIFLLFRNQKEPLLIPEHVIKQIVIHMLKDKQRTSKEIPYDAQISVGLITNIIHKSDLGTGWEGYLRREVVCYLSKKGYRKTLVVGVQPYDGTILGIKYEPLGYTGREARDEKVIPVSAVNIIDPNEKR